MNPHRKFRPHRNAQPNDRQPRGQRIIVNAPETLLAFLFAHLTDRSRSAVTGRHDGGLALDLGLPPAHRPRRP